MVRELNEKKASHMRIWERGLQDRNSRYKSPETGQLDLLEQQEPMGLVEWQ